MNINIKKLLMIALCGFSYATRYRCNVYHGFFFEGEKQGSMLRLSPPKGYPDTFLFADKGIVGEAGFSSGRLVEGLVTNEEQLLKDYLPSFMIVGPKRYSFDYDFKAADGEIFPINISYNLHTDCNVSDVVVKAESFQTTLILVDDYKMDGMYRKYSQVHIGLRRSKV